MNFDPRAFLEIVPVEVTTEMKMHRNFGLQISDCGMDAECVLEIASQTSLAMTLDAAREHLAIAKKMIGEMGYHRRDKEVETLEHEILEHETRESTR